MNHSGPGCNANGPLQEVPGLWFPADLVILQAGKENSPVFADMFSIPQPPSADLERIYGVPVVRMPDDPVELEMFSKAVFDAEYFMPPPARTTIEILIGVLRLAHKYDVHYLRRHALQHLGTVYTTATATPESQSIIRHEIRVPPQSESNSNSGRAQRLMDTSRCFTVLEAGRLGHPEKIQCSKVFARDVQIRSTVDILSFLALTGTTCNTDPMAYNGARLRTIRDRDWSRHANVANILSAWDEGDWLMLLNDGVCPPCAQEAEILYQGRKQKF
ncbi:hypothetical protein DFH07DRAFT_944382 [Mycena maculata]|uniref:BTB domain-containing protein n=1 Tax=Mycena maculata TaxID=230809 RepID=A0AAD7I8Q8_9AGAR|nr:hypothetical protein DFH07DRAFT_944382 [Mycena maculata]